jgi:pilus assembly protein Flp/PilA
MKALMLRSLAGVRRCIQKQSGQDLVEYALLAALVAFGATAALRTLGTGLNRAFTNISSTLSSSLT